LCACLRSSTVRIIRHGAGGVRWYKSVRWRGDTDRQTSRQAAWILMCCSSRISVAQVMMRWQDGGYSREYMCFEGNGTRGAFSAFDDPCPNHSLEQGTMERDMQQHAVTPTLSMYRVETHPVHSCGSNLCDRSSVGCMGWFRGDAYSTCLYCIHLNIGGAV
jgi:hypothetical protein